MIISHPYHQDGDPHLSLDNHSQVVADRVNRLLRSLPTRQRHCGKVLGYLHDFGKVTPQFQSYVHPEKQKRVVDDDRVFNHARLGALATEYALTSLGFAQQDVIAGTLAVAKHHQALPNGADYLHNTLDTTDAIHAQIDRIATECPSAANDLLSAATNNYTDGDNEIRWEDFVQTVRDGTLTGRLQAASGEKMSLTDEYVYAQNALPDGVYDRTLRYWSALTLADKSHAAGLSASGGDRLFGFDTLDRQPLDDYIEQLQSDSSSGKHTQLNQWREDARQQVLAGIHEWIGMDTPPSVATLTLPTGLGKTFTGTTAALTIRDHLLDQCGTPTPLVVYALPYTSIIEQTREQFESQDIWDTSPTESEFTVHHHLSKTVVSDGDEAEDNNAVFLGESWRSGVVLTTFVQLFESLTGPSNGASTKLSALDNAIVILDEPQALPKSWWDGIRREIEMLIAEFNTQFISMTATQPALFDPIDTISLLEAGARHTGGDCPRCSTGERSSHSRREFFEHATRVSYSLHDSALAHHPNSTAGFITHERAADHLLETATETGTSVLSVCNTIASSRQLTEDLMQSDQNVRHIGAAYQELLTQKQIGSGQTVGEITDMILRRCGVDVDDELSWDSDTDPGILVGTFNSRYRPVDRRVLLSVAETLTTAGLPFVFVSTQAIEAGVDISFRSVYRDIAPLDSIVQSAGRCNRSFEWGSRAGTVTIWTLAAPGEPSASDPQDRCPAELVYARDIDDHLQIIAETLASITSDTLVSPPTSIPDVTVATDGVSRYFDRLAEKSVATPEIRQEINNCLADRLQSRSLIQDYDTVDILIGVTESDRHRIEAIRTAYHDGNHQRAYSLLSECADIRVSVPVRGNEETLRSIPRVDHQSHDTEDGIQVLAFTGSHPTGEYDLADGGFTTSDTAVTDRFTI